MLKEILQAMLGTANKLKTARNIKLQGAVSGNADFDGSKNVTIDTTQEVLKDTLSISEDKGKIDLIIKRAGNIVMINVDATVYAQKESLLCIKSLNLPSWAKLTKEYTTSEVLGAFFHSSNFRKENGSSGWSLSSFCRCSIIRSGADLYKISLMADTGEPQEEAQTYHCFISYIID